MQFLDDNIELPNSTNLELSYPRLMLCEAINVPSLSQLSHSLLFADESILTDATVYKWRG